MNLKMLGGGATAPLPTRALGVSEIVTLLNKLI